MQKVNPLDTIVGKTDQAFKDKVEGCLADQLKLIYRPAVFWEQKMMFLITCLAEPEPLICHVSLLSLLPAMEQTSQNCYLSLTHLQVVIITGNL